jgi:hypothetical protein
VKAGLAATATYRGALPQEPVLPRGSGQLVLFALLGLVSLALSAAAGTALVIFRRANR